LPILASKPHPEQLTGAVAESVVADDDDVVLGVDDEVARGIVDLLVVDDAAVRWEM